MTRLIGQSFDVPLFEKRVVLKANIYYKNVSNSKLLGILTYILSLFFISIIELLQ